MSRFLLFAAVAVGGTLTLMGCGGPPPVAQAPPMYNSGPQPGYGGGPPMSNQGAGVYQWQDVPVNQQVPITRAVFDQGGYQIFAQSGETIVVPFVNQNLYALKFGQTGGSPYFVNAGNAPILYLPPGGYLENAAAQNARWYPFSNGFSYTQPVYVTLAPSWNDYVGMGWYPGMHYYGGMWGYSPASVAWMPGFYVNIGGTRYRSYNTYHTYYTTNHGYIPNRVVYNNYNTRTTGSFGSSRTGGSTGSFGSMRSTGSTGSFGGGRRTGGGFGSSTGSTGSFGSGRSSTSSNGGSSFGSGRSNSSFGGGTSSSGSNSGSGRSSSGSFGSGSSGFSNTPRSSGSSFGGGRSTGSSGSFGGGRSSSGGSSFGGGRSSGNSFGGGRRR